MNDNFEELQSDCRGTALMPQLKIMPAMKHETKIRIAKEWFWALGCLLVGWLVAAGVDSAGGFFFVIVMVYGIRLTVWAIKTLLMKKVDQIPSVVGNSLKATRTHFTPPVSDTPTAYTRSNVSVKNTSNNPDEWVGLGHRYAERSEHELAALAFRQALRLAPDSFKAWSNLGVAYLKQGKSDLAANALEIAVRLEPENAFAWADLGSVYLQKQNSRMALSASLRALKLNPNELNALTVVALAAQSLGQKDKVVWALKCVKQLNRSAAQQLKLRLTKEQ